jgi:hypothetical protein
MTNKLTKLLEIAYAGNSEREKLLNKESTEKLFGKETKELLQSNARQVDYLLQEEVYNTISQGAEPWKCMREIVPIIKTDSYSVRVVKGETGTYAEDLAEGANVPIDNQVYTKEDITIKKIGTRPLITNELIEDCLFDIVNLELQKAGMRMENKLNRDILVEILTDTTTTDIDPADAHLAVTDLARARASVATENYMPDKCLFHPTAEGYLIQDSNLAYASFAGTADTLHTGSIPKLLGMTPYTCSVTTGTTAHYWDSTDAANHYYGLVLDSKAHTYLAMRRDLTVEQYDDPIHDLKGISCTMRYGVGCIQPKAGNLILTK